MPDPARPASVLNAVRVMYAGAAVSLLGIGANLTMLGSIKRRLPVRSPGLLASTEHQAIAEFIVGGVVVAALWVFVALMCGRGMRWARMAATALFAVDTVYAADTVSALDGMSPTALVRVQAAAVWLIGLVTVVFLWQRTASAFFGRTPRAS